MKENNEKKKASLKRFWDVEAGEDNNLDDDVMDNLVSAEFGGMPSEDLETSGEEILKEDLQNEE